MSISASLHRPRTLSNPFWHRPMTNGNLSPSQKARSILSSSRRTSRRPMRYSLSESTSQLLSFWNTLSLGQLSKVSLRLLLLLQSPTQEKLSEVQLRTANALRSDFKETGNDSSTIWSMIYGMMIQKTWKKRLTGETPWSMKAKQQRTGIPTPSNNHPAVSLLALHSTVKTRIFHTRTPQRGVTNCTLQKEKEHHPKVGALFFS